MLLLCGPTAAGKNTVGRLLAQQQSRCAVVDFDLIRVMFVEPHRAPWQGEEGRHQQELGIELVCQVALGLHKAGWKVIILDVVTNDVYPIYRGRLQAVNLRTVQLLPTFEETSRRFHERGPVLGPEEFVQVYRDQEAFSEAELRIDNSHLSPQAVVERIQAYL